MVCKFYENSENCIQKRCEQTRYRALLDLMVEFWALEGALGVPRRGPWGASGVPWGSPGAQGRWGVSERGSRGSRGCLGCVPGIIKIINFGKLISYKNRCFVVWAIFYEMKGLSGFHAFSMVFINVPSVEQGGEFIDKTNRNWRFASLTRMKNEQKTHSESWVWEVIFEIPKWRKSYKNK